ncbi:MAG: helix-turn-helix transcriptional regulator [Lachnospiraceae bacterium]|nr:helix-turn-helix transcriptional regulator [Lachnospiraceae bacterium]
MIVTERLVCLRKAKGLTQLCTAKALYISRAAYSSYERGLRQPPADMLVRISALFDVSTDYLLGLCDTPLPYSGFSESDLSVILRLPGASDEEKAVIRFILERTLF